MTILKKIKVSFILHFWLGKYSLILFKIFLVYVCVIYIYIYNQIILLYISNYFFNYFFPATPRLVHILHNSEQPATCFSIVDTGNCLVADSQFDILMQRLKGFYQQRKGFKIESKGQRYEYGDFLIKIGSVLLASSFKGILVEVSIYLYRRYKGLDVVIIIVIEENRLNMPSSNSG